MANNNTPISKIKLGDNLFNIKDILARDSKLDKNNSLGSGRITFNADNLTQGSNSVSLGYLNAAGGNCATALGSQNNAAAAFSGAIGLGLIASGASQIVLGKYNTPIVSDAFEIGNGENSSERKNILRLTKTGVLYIESDIMLGSTRDNEFPISLVDKLNNIETRIIDSQYTLPIATKNRLGGVKIGNNINVDKNGVISVTFPEYIEYTLPIASSSKLGGIKIGNYLSIDNDGVLSVNLPDIPDEYELPMATEEELGGIKISETTGFKLVNGILTYSINKLNQNNPNGIGYIRMNSDSGTGLYSVSLGKNNITKGESSLGLGYRNTVSGVAAAAIGRENNINAASAIGIGKSLQISDESSIAIGESSQISGKNSYSLGQGLKLSNNQTYALGMFNENLIDSFLEVGQGIADNDRKNIFRFSNDGKAYFTNDIFVSKDENNNPINILSKIIELEENPYSLPTASTNILGGIKVGDNLIIDENGVLSAVVNFNSNNFSCTGYFSHNRVANTHIGNNSFASNGTALTSNSVAFGSNTVAGKVITETVEVEDPETGEVTEEEVVSYSGSYAFAEGVNSIAEGYASHAAGEGTKAGYDNQFVIGRYNDNKSTNLFEIGYGDNSNNRINLLELSKTGIFKVNGININTGVQSITETEYNNLTTTEKNKDIIYLITDTNELYYKTNKYGSGSSDDIEANPQESATNSLTSIKISNTVYDIPGKVEANPTDITTDELTSIKIGNTVFDILGTKDINHILSGDSIPTSTIGQSGDLYIQYNKDSTENLTEYIRNNYSDSFGFTLTNWNYDLSDRFEITYKMARVEKFNVPTFFQVDNYIKLDFYFPNNVNGVLYNYNGSSDKLLIYNSIYDCNNYYKIVFDAGKLYVYKGSNLDSINDLVGEYTNITDASGLTNSNMKFFAANDDSSGCNLDLNLFGIKVYNSIGTLIHDYLPCKGGVYDRIDNVSCLTSGTSTGYINGPDKAYEIIDIEKIWYNSINNNNVTKWITMENNIENLNNINLSNLSNNQILKYNSATNKWENTDLSSAIFIGNVPTNYSTEEKVIGTWTDGKPLYQKTKTFTVPSNSYETLPMNIDNFEKACDYRAIVHDESHTDVNYSRPDNENAEYYVSIESNGDFFIRTFRTITATVTVTILYTKTTDTAYTVPVGYSDYYSTNEQIVGRWIDGKPLYQKTIDCGGLANTGTTVTPHNISNIDRIIKMTGTTYSTSNNYTLPLEDIDAQVGIAGAIRLYANNTNVYITTYKDQSEYDESKVTLQYTKITD